MWDILGVGTATVDDLLFLDSFPTPDSKVQLRSTDRQGGGLTATALVAATRLGARCVYAGVLGDDLLSNWIVQDLAASGIDVSQVVRREHSQAIHAVILVEQTTGTRTILYTMEGLTGADDEQPGLETIRQARLLFIDDRGTGDISRVAKIARQVKVPIVADFEQTDDPALIALPDHLIVSMRYAAPLTGTVDPAKAAQRLWHSERAVVVITCGAEGCWYMAEGHSPIHSPTFPVTVVDTTGCGDVFHGAYAAGVIKGLALPERIRLASAAAALKATQPGGRRGIPNWQQVKAFLHR